MYHCYVATGFNGKSEKYFGEKESEESKRDFGNYARDFECTLLTVGGGDGDVGCIRTGFWHHTRTSIFFPRFS